MRQCRCQERRLSTMSDRWRGGLIALPSGSAIFGSSCIRVMRSRGTRAHAQAPKILRSQSQRRATASRPWRIRPQRFERPASAWRRTRRVFVHWCGFEMSCPRIFRVAAIVAGCPSRSRTLHPDHRGAFLKSSQASRARVHAMDCPVTFTISPADGVPGAALAPIATGARRSQ